MIALLQRVSSAFVDVGNERVAAINYGLLVFVGIQINDTEDDAKRLFDRVSAYRVFADDAGKMNLSVSDVKGALLFVPQFTLAADTTRGMRPSFTPAAEPTRARYLFDYLVSLARDSDVPAQEGKFGADMKVGLVNDGPVTFWLES